MSVKDWKERKIQLSICGKFCEDKVDKLLSHQVKSAEIAYYTFEKQLKKCDDFKSEDPLQLLNCYNYKVSKLNTRFSTYYLNQRANLIDRLNNISK